MSLRGLFGLLEQVPAYRGLLTGLRSSAKEQPSLAVPDAARAFFLAALADRLRRPMLIVTARPEDARRLAEDLAWFVGNAETESSAVLHFPESEALPYERLAVDESILHARLHTLARLCTDAPGQRAAPPVAVASVTAIAQRTLDKAAFTAACHSLRVGQRIQAGALLAQWAAMGYSVEPAVEVPGTASLRGGIVDIFTPSSPLPARIELMGDTVESIRLFDPNTQRSVQQVQELKVIPAKELLPFMADESRIQALLSGLSAEGCTPEAFARIQAEAEHLLRGSALEDAEFYSGLFNTGCLLDYLPSGTLLVLNEPWRTSEAGREMDEQGEQLFLTKRERGEIPQGFPSPYWSWPQLQDRLGKTAHALSLQWLGSVDTGAKEGSWFTASPSFWGRLEAFAASARRQVGEGKRIVIVSHHAQRLAEILRDQGLSARVVQEVDEAPAPSSVVLLQGFLAEGFALPLASGALVVLTDSEIFGHAKRRRPVRSHALRREAFLSELRPGSYLVHVDHGIGRFVDTQRVSSAQGEKEYLILEYAEGDKLFVPTEALDRLTPYFAPGDQAPSLTRLGTQEWARAKERARGAALEMAEELLELYSSREVVQRPAYGSDTPWQQELEDSFPYVETRDQMAAISEVKWDLEQSKPMDRLVCGDVGYGKTEVALRAAFKVVQEGKQVALLCPTTVLAQQHYATFSQRLTPFPVRVEVLSRFRTGEEQEAVVEGLKAGAVDIVIGTHRLLQKDVQFKYLSLVIVDDEQRFGVAQKERLKSLRREVDVLTLTATPIPRTLYMALSGIRDMSAIDTPPEARQPVRTYVAQYSDDLVREAVLRELDRGGQVFFVHNRVRDLYEWAARVQELVPTARVVVGHGRMDDEELSTVMSDFMQGKGDVLVCTTIIEAGLDIPNVNTLLVHRPELLGLAQMYQLRGRVGRGAHRAYAYFLVPPGKRLTETAEKRLKAILAHQELGAGFRIAMKDLELRGAGNLLGPEQSGHIQAVGFDLYCQLLQESVEELRTRDGQNGQEGPLPGASTGQVAGHPSSLDVKIDLPLPAFIPESCVPDLAQRLSVYQRLARMTSPEEVSLLSEELQDRFGPLPEPVQHLLYIVRVKALAAQATVETVTAQGSQLVLQLKEPVGGARPALQSELGNAVRVGSHQLRLEMEGRWQDSLVRVLERTAAFRQKVLTLHSHAP